jgi:hypothetical protein
MPAYAQIIDIDRGAAALMNSMKQGGTVKVGVFGDKAGAAHGEGLTVVEVATVHEFGDPEQGIPRRSFIRDYVDLHRRELEARLTRLGRQVIKGKSLKTLLDQYGLVVVGEIQTRIANKISPPNSPVTVKRKGSDVPLIDTGQLRSSIAHLAEVSSGFKAAA